MTPRRGRILSYLFLAIIALALGIAAGVYWQAPIARALNLPVAQAPGGGDGPKQSWTCSMHPQIIRDGPGMCPMCHMELTPVGQGPAANPEDAGMVVIDSVMVQNMGVRTAAVTRGTLQQHIRAVGYLDEAQPNILDINPRFSGWIDRMYADSEGMPIGAGDPLLDLYSPELQIALEEAIAARKARSLLPEGSGQIERAAADALGDAASRKLELMGLPASTVAALLRLDRAPRVITLTSPVTGHIIEKPVVAGAAFKSGDRILRIVDHTTLWLDARIPERELPLVRVGQKAIASVASLPGVSVEGQVILIHPHIDDATRTAMVRLAVANTDLKLRPGMYASLRIAWQSPDEHLLIPREAVIDTGERQLVFLDRGRGRFEPRPVTIGLQGDGGMVQVLSGLHEGDHTVVSGQFLLDSESRLKEVERKLTAGDPPAPSMPAQTDDSLPTPPTSDPLPAEMAAKLHAVLEAYLALARPLGEIQSSDTPVDPAPLITAAFDLRAASESESDRELAQAVFTAARALTGRPIDGQREKLIPVSTAVLRLMLTHPPTASHTPTLYVMHCPMVNAHWLQTTEKLANPYYPNTMKECGEVQLTIQGITRP